MPDAPDDQGRAPRAVLRGLSQAIPEAGHALERCLSTTGPERLSAPVHTLLRHVARGNAVRAQSLAALPEEDLVRAVAEGVPRLPEEDRGRIASGLKRVEAASGPEEVAAALEDVLVSLSRAPQMRHSIMTFASSRMGGDGGPDPGTLIDGRFETIELVGAGGMSVVCRARDRESGDVVALKFLKADLAREAATVRRFGEAAKLWQSLAHPGIVRVYGAGVAGDRPYIAMEWIEGPTLRALLDERGRLGWEEAWSIASGVLAALAFAHEKGVLHLDVKPENILLPRPDQPKIGDFDLARVATLQGGLSLLPGAGTPYYMAPEQRLGQKLDTRADVYAAGVMIYEMLSGRLPGRTSPQLHDKFGVAVEASLAVEAALDDDMARRPRDAAGLLQSLSKAHAPRPEPHARPGAQAHAAPEADLVRLGPNEWGYTEYRAAKDGSVLIEVPGGTSWMGSGSDRPNEAPRHRIRLDTYLIGKHEVTNAQYRAFCRETGSPPPPPPPKGFAYPDYVTNPVYDVFPVVNVSWTDAQAYCAWAGLRLPTEAEWEKAASWVEKSQQSRRFPWGSDPPIDDRAVFGKEVGKGAYMRQSGSLPSGASPYGALDMSGNVEEWVADWYDEGYYAACQDLEWNPIGPKTGKCRVVRGGSWFNDPWGLRVTFRFYSVPAQRYGHVGFRVARGFRTDSAPRD